MDDKLELVALTEVENEFELGIITAILKDNGIPFIIKNKGSGGYMRIVTGSSPYSTCIMVEKSMLERAGELITPITED
jgi:hypothetical protein